MLWKEFRWKEMGDCPAADKLWDNYNAMLCNDGELCSKIISTAFGKINRISCQVASKTIRKYKCIYMWIYCSNYFPGGDVSNIYPFS